jgi:hypothetical protein
MAPSAHSWSLGGTLARFALLYGVNASGDQFAAARGLCAGLCQRDRRQRAQPHLSGALGQRVAVDPRSGAAWRNLEVKAAAVGVVPRRDLFGYAQGVQAVNLSGGCHTHVPTHN